MKERDRREGASASLDFLSKSQGRVVELPLSLIRFPKNFMNGQELEALLIVTHQSFGDPLKGTLKLKE